MPENRPAPTSGVGARLRALRQQRRLTLADAAEAVGVSVSTLSRLESGRRRPGLELLLPLARTYGVPLDALIDTLPVGDPRVHPRAIARDGMTMLRLSSTPTPIQAYKIVLPPGPGPVHPELRSHDGYNWLYVLGGRLRLVLGDRDMLLTSGEAAEFDSAIPHWFGSSDDHPAEILTLFSRQGHRTQLRAAPRSRSSPA